MLFADDAGVGVGATAFIVSAVVGFLTLLVNKKYDKTTTDLKTQNTLQAAQIAQNEKLIDASKAKEAEQDRRLDDCAKQHARCEEEHRKAIVDRELAKEELAAKITTENKKLQDQIDLLMKRHQRS